LQEDGGAARADAVVGQGLHDLVKSEGAASGAEDGRHLKVCFERAGRARGPWRTPVEVAEDAAAHGWRLAVESTGHDVTTFLALGHDVFSC